MDLIKESKTNKKTLKADQGNRLARGAGMILPISALPSPYGIGTFGKAAYRFVDFLNRAGIRYWQILPMGPTSYGDSPYSSFSSHAGNPYFIDLEILCEENLIYQEELDSVDFGSDPRKVDYALLYNTRYPVLERAYSRLRPQHKEEMAAFREENADWLEDYAFFMALKKKFLDAEWTKWPKDARDRDPHVLPLLREGLEEAIDFQVFMQYAFYKQWDKLRAYANRRQIQIIGDIPIYIAMDSADAWIHQEYLDLDEKKRPNHVSGAPPDAYAEDGQLWGNPLYKWDKMAETGFAFWKDRVRTALNHYDVIRLDHFRGFAAYWSVPAEDKVAKYGNWEDGPGYALFEALEVEFGIIPLILEDLGYITPDVDALREAIGAPGMKVVQFSFNGDPKNAYLPHNYTANTAVYTSTHDSSTLAGWLSGVNKKEKAQIEAYFPAAEGESQAWAIIRGCMASVSDLCVVQLQDSLQLDDSARMNSPGTLGGNWQWRALETDFDDPLAERLQKISLTYGRIE